MPESSTQSWDPARYAANARFVSDLGMPVVEMLSPQPGERILDLGCGDGALTTKLVEIGCHVIGIDSSPQMVAAARERHVDARVADGQSLSFDCEFDAVFSNAALHWMKDGRGVIDSVWRALKPGGRFVGECGGRGNVATIIAAVDSALARRDITLPALWFFPGPDEYWSLLEDRGFAVGTISLFPRPTPLPGDISSWLETFMPGHLGVLPPGDRPTVLREIVEELRPRLCDLDGRWTADYMRLRFSAIKPA
jgi:SAM-dependent methyltransferase